MALPSPVVETPDTTALMESLKARSANLAGEAWSRFQQSHQQTQMQAAGPGQMPGAGYSDAIGGWGHPGDAVNGQGAPGGLGHPGQWKGYSKDSEGVRSAFKGRLRELGMPEHAIEGLGWNIQDESNWNTGAVGDGGKSFGLVQWYNDRKAAAMDYAKQRGMDPSDPVFQAENVWREMNGPYKGVYEKAVQAGQPHLAADIFLRQYEIPAAEHMRRRSASYLSRGANPNPMAPMQAPVPVQVPGGYNLALSNYGRP